MSSVKFWVEDPSILFTDLVFFPTIEMSREQKLNALTRLAIIISVVMYCMDYNKWLVFLLTSIIILIMVNYAKCSEKENFTIVPTHIGDDFHTTVVAPLFSEEHRVPPPAYDHYTSVDLTPTTFKEPIRPQEYPYGQYLTRSNLLPGDEYATHVNPNGGAKTAREYVNSTYLKHDLAFKENMTRLYHKKLNRRFRHNTNDTFSPYHSY